VSNIVTALNAVMHEVGAVKKGDFNEGQRFNFRGIDAVVNAVSPALRRNGIVVTPELKSIEYSTVEIGRNRTSMGHVRVTVAYTFVCEDGSALTATVPGEAMDSGDKATAKAMSVAFRTALLQALSLPTDEPDPDAQSYERAPVVSQESMTDEILARALGAISDAVDDVALDKILDYARGMTMTDAQAAAIGEAAQEKRVSWS
jgi:hypothetical protein